ncbi:ABC transporter substrate-binding protein [Sediminispirochaeta bajacaliforniensis]|uniref:ABC transporter substrate-binding protein n=1 Tax=Sediminispirochaeta bajacaliforniensis TaxID=148 RepID=UPI00035E1AE7|nr:sugar ABC transporter substrate-binding protein [Sediminispirochaeta bajacaliforniensis]
MKRALGIVVLIMVCTCFIFSQGETETEGTGKAELTLWHYFSTENIQVRFQEYVDMYNAQSKGSHITVTILPFADFKTQLSVGAAASTLPDIVILDNCDTVSYAAMGMFEDITDYVSDWESTKNIFPEIMATCTYKNRLYALPCESNNLEIIYNDDMLRAAGVTPPTSFDELFEAAKRLTTEDHYGFAISGIESEESTYQFLPFFWSAGGQTMKLNSDAGVRSLGLFTRMVEAGYMPKECISWSQSELSSQFVAGNIAMEVMGPWQIQNYQNKGISFGICKIPADKYQRSVYGGENMAIVKGKNAGEAAKFLEWFLDYDRNSEWNLYTDEFVASKSTLSDPSYINNEYWIPFVEMIPNTRARDVTTVWPEISSAYQLAIQGALSGQMTVEEALKAGQKLIDKALNN